MVDKPRLSREYLHVPLGLIDLDVTDLTVHRVAFMDAGVEPTDTDWVDAIAVGEGDSLFRPAIGPSLVLLVGPDRGDLVDSEDLDVGDHQVWVEVSATGSDERVVRVAGILTVSTTGGA